MVTPSQVMAAEGPIVVATEYPIGVPWDVLRARTDLTVVVLPRHFPDVPRDVAAFDASHGFAAMTPAGVRMHLPPFSQMEGPTVAVPPATPWPPVPAVRSGPMTVPDEGSPEEQPMLDESDWLTYIVGAILGMVVTTAIWQNMLPGIIVGLLMISMLVFADKRYGKGIPRG